MRSDQIAKVGHLSLNHFQGWRLHNLSGQPVLMLDYPHGEKVSPYIQSEPLFFQLMPICLSYLSA